MFLTAYNLTQAIINIIHVSLWILFVLSEFYNNFIVPLKRDADTCKKKHDILYESIQKLKTIVDIDKGTLDTLEVNFDLLKRDIDVMYSSLSKRINKIEQELLTDETDVSEKEDTEDLNENSSEELNKDYNEVSNEESSIEKDVLPIQNHITFPHYTMFDDSNYKTSNTKSGCRTLKDNTRLLSIQLSRFLNKAEGSCMTFEEVYAPMWQMIDSETDLNERNLRKLFGITENKDYDITKDNLDKYLEPHLKKLVTYP
jgi:hypothetical protein